MSEVETPFNRAAGKVTRGKLSEAKSIAEALKIAGADFRVSKRPITSTTRDGQEIHIKKHFAIVRDDAPATDEPFAVVTDRYGIAQNQDAFGMYDPLLQDGSVKIDAIGHGLGGRLVWCLVRLEGAFEAVKGDPSLRYCISILRHDGTGCCRTLYTPIRAFCSNQLGRIIASAKSEEGMSMSFRHTTNVRDRLKDARVLMKLLTQAEQHDEAIYSSMAKRRLDVADFEDYVTDVLPITENASDSQRFNAKRAVAEITELAETGKGTHVPGVRGSLWGAYNAVVEWVDWGRGTPSGPDKPTSNSTLRVVNMTIGQGARIKNRAMRVATEML